MKKFFISLLFVNSILNASQQNLLSSSEQNEVNLIERFCKRKYEDYFDKPYMSEIRYDLGQASSPLDIESRQYVKYCHPDYPRGFYFKWLEKGYALGPDLNNLSYKPYQNAQYKTINENPEIRPSFEVKFYLDGTGSQEPCQLKPGFQETIERIRSVVAADRINCITRRVSQIINFSDRPRKDQEAKRARRLKFRNDARAVADASSIDNFVSVDSQDESDLSMLAESSECDDNQSLVEALPIDNFASVGLQDESDIAMSAESSECDDNQDAVQAVNHQLTQLNLDNEDSLSQASSSRLASPLSVSQSLYSPLHSSYRALNNSKKRNKNNKVKNKRDDAILQAAILEVEKANQLAEATRLQEAELAEAERLKEAELAEAFNKIHTLLSEVSIRVHGIFMQNNGRCHYNHFQQMLIDCFSSFGFGPFNSATLAQDIAGITYHVHDSLVKNKWMMKDNDDEHSLLMDDAFIEMIEHHFYIIRIKAYRLLSVIDPQAMSHIESVYRCFSTSFIAQTRNKSTHIRKNTGLKNIANFTAPRTNAPLTEQEQKDQQDTNTSICLCLGMNISKYIAQSRNTNKKIDTAVFESIIKDFLSFIPGDENQSFIAKKIVIQGLKFRGISSKISSESEKKMKLSEHAGFLTSKISAKLNSLSHQNIFTVNAMFAAFFAALEKNNVQILS